ncbi:hypothetical protein J6590_066675 [Homalodisca vitripennis]|nr:hypothetical protein J6590_066675 [Homalodisca vitripennis]
MPRETASSDDGACSSMGCNRAVAKPVTQEVLIPCTVSRCRQWLINSKREDLGNLPLAKLHTRYICARHFPDSAFMNSLRNRKTHDAVPVPYYKLPKLPEVGSG